MQLSRENILKGCIALGIIAIAVSAYIQYGAPYLHERQLEKLDEQRISDLNTLNSVIQTILIANPKANLGEANTVYISLPDASSTCGDLNLPSLASGWQYHCVAASTVQSTDGTGWLPFAIASSTLSRLPIDPINSTSTLNYYAFVTQGGRTATTTYTISAGLDSQKYLQKNVSSDDPTRYVVGNNFTLWSEASGLVGYWPMNDGAGPIARNEVVGSPSMTLQNITWASGGCLPTGCISLQPTLNQRIGIQNMNVPGRAMTLLVWVKLQKSTKESYEFVTTPSFTFYIYDTEPDLGLYGSIKTPDAQYFSNEISSTEYNEWHEVGFEYDLNAQGDGYIANILDGQILDQNQVTTQEMPFDKVESLIIDDRDLYMGEINMLQIYNYALDGTDLQSNFIHEKSDFNL